MANTIEQRKKDGSHRHYAIEIQDKDDLSMLVAHLPGFWDTIEANDRTMVIEVWAEPKPQETT